MKQTAKHQLLKAAPIFGGTVKCVTLKRTELINILTNGQARRLNPRKNWLGLTPSGKGVYSIFFHDSLDTYFGSATSEGMGMRFKKAGKKKGSNHVERLMEANDTWVTITTLINPDVDPKVIEECLVADCVLQNIPLQNKRMPRTQRWIKNLKK